MFSLEVNDLQPLRAGLIGIGMMGRNHARVLRELADVELVVIADQDGDKHNVAQGVPVVSRTEEALTFDLDCAIIAVPTMFHEEVAVQLSKNKVPTLIEKPLADSVESAERIIKAFEETDTLAFVGHIERFNPAIIELKKRLQNGDIGEVFQVATRRQSYFPGRISDVGVVKDLATHDIDLVMSITGSTYRTATALTAHRSGRPTEDMVIANALLENGVIVNHVVNWLSPLKERVTVVTGESGIFVADTLTGDLTVHRNGEFDMDWDSLSSFRGVSEGDTIRFAFPRVEPLKAEIANFIAAVRRDPEVERVTLSQGLEVLRVVDLLLSSAIEANLATS